MNTLRVRLPSPFDPSAASDWWRVGGDGRPVERGSGPPERWPPADRVEAVLGADTVRLIAVALPPLSESRRASAVAYALEDQLAAGAGDVRVCAPAPRGGGPTLARVVDRATMDWLAARTPKFHRIVAEPDLVDDDRRWHWCVDTQGRGFVRRADGSAFATGGPADDGSLPAELGAALERAAPSDAAPIVIVVDAPLDITRLEKRPGVRYAAGKPWTIDERPADAWTRAPDLLAGTSAPDARPRAPAMRAYAPAVLWIVAALAVQVLGSYGVWARDRFAVVQSERAIVALARESGIEATDANSAAAALARRASAAAHASGRAADGDLLPLLSRSATTLAALPPGSVRRLAYADGRLTADLAGLGEKQASRVVHDLARAGLRPLAAPVAGGTRVAVSPGP